MLRGVKNLISGIMELLQSQASGDGVVFLTLDFRDAFKQLHVVPSERPILAGAAMDGFFSYRSAVRGWVRATWVVQSRCVGPAQHPSVVGYWQSPDQLLCR